MSTIQERIQQLRNSTGLGRTLFSRHVGINQRALQAIEYDGKKPGADILAAITDKYPQYIVWILTGKTDPGAGHLRPDIKPTATRSTAVKAKKK